MTLPIFRAKQGEYRKRGKGSATFSQSIGTFDQRRRFPFLKTFVLWDPLSPMSLQDCLEVGRQRLRKQTNAGFVSPTPKHQETHFQLLESEPEEYIKGGKKVSSLMVPWYLKYWSSSSICLLLLTFQSPQIVAPWILCMFCNYSQCEKDGVVCLLHFTQNESMCYLSNFDVMK